MTLGALINQYINEHKISMRRFATMANVSHSYIAYLVNGAKPDGTPLVPSIDKYRSIAKAMGIDVNDLIGMVDDDIAWGSGDRKDNSMTIEELRIIRLYRIASERDKELIKTILKQYESNISLSDVS